MRSNGPDGDGCWFCLNGRTKKRVIAERDADRDMKEQVEETWADTAWHDCEE